jgi:titin
LEGRILLRTFFVTNVNDRGVGSLRDAIESANANVGSDIIQFNIPGGFNTITPATPLPAVTGPTVIDGTTDPDFAGEPTVGISGRALNEVDNVTGLELRGGDSTLRGLAFSGWVHRVVPGITRMTAVRISSDRNVVEGCWFGAWFDAHYVSDPWGSHNFFGVRIEDVADGNRIGGPSAAQRNVFSGHRSVAVSISGDRNTVLGNYFGLRPTGGVGSSSDHNAESVFVGGDGNVIGGAAAGARNVIGDSTVGVSVGELHDPGGPVVPAVGNTVAGNYIGTDASGLVAVPTWWGISLHGYAANTTIGGSNPGEGNVIAASRREGIAIEFSVANTTIQGNLIGTDATGRIALSNDYGIVAGGAMLVGGAEPGARNVVSGNRVGIYLTGSATRVEGNYIGTDVTGTATLGNDAGVVVEGGAYGSDPGNRIGGTVAAARNVISGNRDGILFRGSLAHDNVVQGNYIGLTADGSAPLRNFGAGVRFAQESTGNVLGGDGAAARNVISGNGAGVVFDTGASANTVRFNYIGTDPSGLRAVPNGVGVEVDGTPEDRYDDVLGNTVERNLVSGNTTGVVIHGAAARANALRANVIGADSTAIAALGNAKNGVFVTDGAGGNVIGGDLPSHGNLISGNGENGVTLGGAVATIVSNNLIGVGLGFGSATDLPPLANAVNGVLIEGASSSNRVRENTIAHNREAGVRVTGGGRNDVAANAMFTNGGLGIDLGPPGPTPNDPGDGDAGPNDLQNFPVIDLADSDGTHTRVQGTLASRLASRFRLDFYETVPALGDPSGFGEGVLYLGRTEVVTDVGGTALFSVRLPAVQVGRVITATASRIVGGDAETSEFSRGVPVAAAGDITPPAVTALFLSGTKWSNGFTSYLESLDLGEKEFGFSVPGGPAQLRATPWTNVNRISVRFGERVKLSGASLSIKSARGIPYEVTAFAYDDATDTATWTLAEPIWADLLTVALSREGQEGVTDDAGNFLDGEWSDGSDSFPSGDDVPGGDFRASVAVLPGDVTRDGRVNVLDWVELRRRYGRSTASPGPAGSLLSYTPFHDVNGDGAITVQDMLQVRRNLLRTLPPGQPAAPAPAGALTTSVTRALFGSQAIV